MLKIYFKTAIRKLAGQRISGTINILGLALGICTGLVIYLIVSYELSFDTFHPDRDRIYRVVGTTQGADGAKDYVNSIPATGAQAIRTGLSGIQASAAIFRLQDSKATITRPDLSIMKFDGNVNGLPTIVAAEQQYFDIFHYTWLAGDRRTALDKPFTVVLTEHQAKKYFGATSPDRILGKQITYSDTLRVTVSGIVRGWERNTDLGFTDFISFSTLRTNPSCWFFVKLAKGGKQGPTAQALATFGHSHIPNDPGIRLDLALQPLADLHFNDRYLMDDFRKAHLPTLYALVGIALFILLLAVVNFINLSTAQSIRRSKEIGIRKVLGGGRGGLILQFLTETLLLTTIAAILSLLLIHPVLSLFGSFIPNGVVFHLVDARTWTFLVTVVLLTTATAGIYPAFVLSSQKPMTGIQGQLAGSHRAGAWLRKGLIVFQFSIAIGFIIAALVVNRQLWFTRHKDLGFVPDAVITIPAGSDIQNNRVFAQKIATLAGVNGVALQSSEPLSAAHIGGVSIQRDDNDKTPVAVSILCGDDNIASLYRMRLLAGTGLSGGDTTKDIIVNASCAKALGFTDPATLVGRTLNFLGKNYPVAGVIDDYHDHSFHEPIEPIVIFHLPVAENSFAVKLSFGKNEGPRTSALLARIADKWKSVYPGTPFSYSFVDESIKKLYEKDEKTASLIDTAMAITIFICCMGVFGLVLFSAESRKKEISIRKVLGATVGHITMMLSRDFLVLVTIALLVASPVAWYFIRAWLQGFVYRVPIDWWVFALAGIVIIGITWLTVNILGIRAASTNPVTNLRTS